LATITEGEGIDVTNEAGSITIACEDASTTNKGVVELATGAETVTGTDSDRAVTPDGLTDRLAAPGAIGGTTPGAISGTTGSFSSTLTTNHDLVLNSALGTQYIVVANDTDTLTFAESGGTDFAACVVKARAITLEGTTRVGDTNISSEKIEINHHGSGNRNAYIDFVGDDTYTDFGLRVVRYNTGENTSSEIRTRGTGALGLVTQDLGAISFKTNDTLRLNIAADGNIIQADSLYFATDEIRARDSGGLLLRDDSGTLGITIADGGVVTLGTALGVASGGTGAATLTDHGLLVGSGTSAVTPLAAMTNGQIVVGATGADPAPQTLSGDATLDENGVLTLTTNAVETANITDGATTTDKIGTGAATGVKLSKTIVSSGSQEISTGSSWTPAAGEYMICVESETATGTGIGLYVSGAWHYNQRDGIGGYCKFDGTNQRIRNDSALTSYTVYYQTF
jgi:hypothetical protein